MSKIKNVVVLLVILVLLIGMAITVNATDTTISLDNLLTGQNSVGTTNTTETPGTANTVNTVSPTNTVNTVNTVNGGSIIQPSNNDTTGSAENNLPQTGVTEDITVMFFIVVSAIGAIYAYRKIRDYRV